MSWRLLSLFQPRKLSFGAGAVELFADDFSATGRKSLVVLTAPPIVPLIGATLDRLRKHGVRITLVDAIVREPTISDLESTLALAADAGGDSVVGIGGGSVLDVAKLVAAKLRNPQPVSELFGIGNLKSRSAYLACIPTTSGTGSEVSPNAILLDESDKMKKGVVSPLLVPDAAYVDPLLTLGLPPKITAETGLDALCHCIEAYTNKFAHPLVDMYALEGIRLIANHLCAAVTDGKNVEARTALALGSLYGGLCLGPVNTSAVHALSYPLGGEFHIAHGLANAILLPEVLSFNVCANVKKHADVAVALGVERSGTALEVAEQGVEQIRALVRSCKIPAKLSELGVDLSMLDKLSEMAMGVQRLLKNNPKDLTIEDVKSIYRKMF
ncbi:MAG: iron-containing alcohol dehydrogenase [Prevotellaceae bacterium]|jgi:alcohol dehydrogenase class IV|nr:iron-containing alcohol dehydrogenase [Prevotellaceae bacterium]